MSHSNGERRRAVGYLRVSTNKQDLGPEAQKVAIERFVETNGWSIGAEDWFTDRQCGADEIHDRSQLSKLLARLEEGGVHFVIAYDRSRIARDALVAATIDRAVEERGARTATADGIDWSNTPTAKFVRTVMDAKAELERAQIREKTKGALAVKKARGERVSGGIPYGWALDPNGRRRTRTGWTSTKLVPCHAERAIMEKVRELRAEGYTFRCLADRLFELGLRPRVGERFRPMAISRILSTPEATNGSAHP